MTPDESVDAFRLGRSAARPEGPCPDPALLAGFAEGRLLDAEADLVAAHAATCAACREAMTAVAGDGAGVGSDATGADAGAPARADVVRPRWRVLVGGRGRAKVAAAVVAIGAGAFFLARAARDAAPADLDGRLVATASALSRAEPALFGGFTPLSHDERVQTTEGRERGGIRLLGPTGTLLSARPTFRWIAVPGATGYDVTVARNDGAPTWRRTAPGSELPYPTDVPALEPGGRYVWTVASDGVLGGRVESRRTFAVATSEETDAFSRARAAIDRGAPADLRDLLAAHWALRHGLLEEAARLARAHAARAPDDAVGGETLQAIERRLGTAGDGAAGPR